MIPTTEDLLRVCARASVGDFAARVEVPEDASDDEPTVLLGRALNVLLGDLEYRSRKQEEALRALAASREARYRAIFEQALECIATLTPEGKFVEVNRRFAELLGREATEFIGLPFEAILREADRDEGARMLRDVAGGARQTARRGATWLRADGALVRVDSTMVLVRAADGPFVKLLATDVTRRHEEDRQRRALLDVTRAANRAVTEERLCADVTRALSQYLPTGYLVGFWRWDDGGLRYVGGVNYPADVLARIRGTNVTRENFPPLEAVALGRTLVVPDVAADPRFEWLAELARAHSIHSLCIVPIFEEDEILGTLHLATRGGAEPDRADVRLFERAARELAHTMARRRALAAMREANEAQANALRQLRRLNGELEDFTYTVAHDIAEPLRGIETLAAFLEEDVAKDLDEEHARMLGQVRQSAARLRRMVRGMLELSRVGRRVLTREEFAPEASVRDVVDGLAERIRGVGATIEVRDLPESIVAQRVGFEQMVTNLVTNALRHAARPGLRIVISGWTAENGWEFEVRDNGPGIPTEFRERIFQVFQRGPESAPGEGVGAGLAIVRKIALQHGGAAWVEEAPGGGAAFRFRLGYGAEETAPTIPDGKAARGRLRGLPQQVFGEPGAYLRGPAATGERSRRTPGSP